MATIPNGPPPPSAIFSLLDTDLYKLTMQCAILQHFPTTPVAYALTNRTPHMKLNRAAYNWLREQIRKLGDISVTEEEVEWLGKTCGYFGREYLEFLRGFKLRPEEHVELKFTPEKDDEGEEGEGEGEDMVGEISLETRGLWVETILYEIPLLALVSEAYFKFVDRDWNHDDQLSSAKQKGLELLENGCVFSEFGSRRRRDYKTHDLVIQGLVEASTDAQANGKGWKGKFTGTSNVHLAMKHGIQPIGTVAHEWFMGIAALTQDYANANELAMQYWTSTFGRGVLAIALTDTFGTAAFLKAFKKPAAIKSGGKTTTTTTTNSVDSHSKHPPTYAEIFTGVRQDSGDPLEYLKLMKEFYISQNITEKKVIVFSDSLNIQKCIQYKHATDAAGLTPSFGVGTFFTNDFLRASTKRKQEENQGEKSVPLNIVIKLSEAGGMPAIKLSDNKGKNMGDGELVTKVKEVVGYEEREWGEGDEGHRWDR